MGLGEVGQPESHYALSLQESPTRETGEPFPSTKESHPTFLEGSPGSPSATGLPLRAGQSPDSSAPEPGEPGFRGQSLTSPSREVWLQNEVSS